MPWRTHEVSQASAGSHAPGIGGREEWLQHECHVSNTALSIILLYGARDLQRGNRYDSHHSVSSTCIPLIIGPNAKSLG